MICVATELEGALLRPHIPVLVTGVGAVNAAYSLTRFLERKAAHCATQAVIACGIAGAYPQAFDRYGMGSVVCAESECYGDLGAASANGFLDLQALGFPLIPGAEPLYNTLPLDLFPTKDRARFITVNTCTGSDEAAGKMESRTGGAIESMEGAAIVHVCTLFGIPAGEIRGISNRAGNRDRSSWRVKEAAEAAQQALLGWLKDYY